jgi:ABC-2 type transport system ATP-binding protein
VAEVVIAVEHLEKRYGDLVAVRDVSFEVRRGEIFGILGPNGSGKTTTVECLQGLRHIDGGTVRVLGFDPNHHANELRHHIGAQLQESALPDRIKVWEALELFSSMSRSGPPWPDVMDEWGLSDKRNAVFASLSGGQQQRLFIALALVNAPEIVFLDEMTTGLDPASRRVAWDLVEQVRAQGTTVILVTHFMDEAQRLCDCVAIIDDHRVVASGSPAQLIAEAKRDATVTFSAAGDLTFLDHVPGVRSISRAGPIVSVVGDGALLANVASALVGHGLAPEDLDGHRATLEDVYLDLTGATG